MGKDETAIPVKADGKVKTETAAAVIDLDDDDDDVECSIVPVTVVKNIKSEIVKREKVKAERIDVKQKKHKKVKVKKEKKNQDADEKTKRSRSRNKEKDKGKEKDRGKEKKSKKAESDSDSSDSSEESSVSQDTLYKRIKPYTKVMLINLVRKAELNGMQGQVVHPSVAVCPCPPGCVLVRLETGREIAVKPPNVQVLNAFHRAPQQTALSQDQRLKQVLKTIKANVDTVMDRTEGERKSLSILGGSDSQGGMSHLL